MNARVGRAGIMCAVILTGLCFPAGAGGAGGAQDGALASALDKEIPELEFRNERLESVLLVIAEVAGFSLLTDETVTGSVSVLLEPMSAAEALDVLSAQAGVFWWSNGRVVHVSRVRVEYDSGGGGARLRAVEAPIAAVVGRLAAAPGGPPIIFDPLPSEPVTVRGEGLDAIEAVRLVLRRHPRFSVEGEEGHIYVRDTESAEREGQPRTLEISREGTEFSARIHEVALSAALSRLFAAGEREYVFLASPGTMVRDVRFTGHSFDQILERVLAATDASFDVRDDTYYVFDVDRRNVLERLEQSVRLEPEHLTVSQLERLLPPELSRGGALRMAPEEESIVVTGRADEVGAVLRFLEAVDRPSEGRRYRRFDLSHVAVGEVLSRLPDRFSTFDPTVVPGANALVARLSAERAEELQRYLELVDRSSSTSVVRLRYIRAEQLIRNLPPEVEREHIHTTPDPRVVMVSGSAEARSALRSRLSDIDKPVPQVRYQLLVVQYQNGRSVEWNTEIENAPAEAGESTVLLGRVGELLSLDFDIVSALGYRFALDLNHRISTNEARVLADTTLNGLSGEPVEFQNTNTFRYRDQEIDPETGERESLGVTREITSGLLVGIEGWASGDGMITMDIAATLSRRGTDVSSDGTNPPPTSERLVDTQIRTPSGRPVIIGGLIQQDLSENVRKTPILGSIPLLGNLFRSTTRSVEETELVLYVLPVLEKRPERDGVAARLERYFERLVEDAS